MECNLRMHCTICHSKTHSVDLQCGYNLLNKTTTPVREIHPENTYQDNRHGQGNRSYDDRSRYEDGYQSN